MSHQKNPVGMKCRMGDTGMTEYKKGDKVILNPPGSSHPQHNLLMEKEGTIAGELQITDDLEWYPIELSGGVSISAPAKWIRKKVE